VLRPERTAVRRSATDQSDERDELLDHCHSSADAAWMTTTSWSQRAHLDTAIKALSARQLAG
jgi:hypothetical protein